MNENRKKFSVLRHRAFQHLRVQSWENEQSLRLEEKRLSDALNAQ